MASVPSSPFPTSSSIVPVPEGSTQPTAPSAGPFTRLQSLKSTKDSTDNLRQRKAKAKGHKRQQSSSTKGRDFRVGNIGNNGLLYLRPVNRASESVTVPTNASVSLKAPSKPTATTSTSDPDWRHSIASGTGTYQSTNRPDSVASISPPPAPQTPKGYSSGSRNTQRTRHTSSETPPSRGTFKVVIDRAQHDEEASKLYNIPSLPRYHLGLPQSAGKNDSLLQGNLQAEGDSQASAGQLGYDTRDRSELVRSRSPFGTRPASHDSVTDPPGLTFDRNSHRRTASAEAMTSRSNDFTEEEFRERSPTNLHEIRVSPSTGQILAASIPELIVRITSPKRLDYDLLSDFFLTYRLFISPHDLASRLIQRLRVSVRSGDGWSRIVRVRTFVALRHWILNYFVDDFVSDYALRVQFCDMVNELCQGLKQADPQQVGDLRILDELKRCWRHTCALFWDVPMPPVGSYIDQDILPGGLVGSRLPDPPQMEQYADSEKGQTQHLELGSKNASAESSREQVDRAGVDSSFNKKLDVQASSSASSTRAAPEQLDERESLQVVSCSIPTKHGRHPSRGPRPVPAKIQTTGRAKHSHAGCGPARKQHNRSASFSDALRDERVPLPAQRGWEEESPAMLQQQMLPGSLIRGALLSPSAPYVEAVVPQSPIDGAPPDTVSKAAEEAPALPETSEKPSPWVNPGVRRLIGSMRRALSVRNNAMPPAMGSFVERRASMSSEASAPFIAAPIGEPGVPKRKLVGGRTRLRVDLLAAEVSEAFKTAVREVAEAQQGVQPELSHQLEAGNGAHHDEASLQRPLMPGKVHSSVTLGSRSIVIMDDTNGQITPKPGAGFFGIERTESDVISPGETVGSQRQDVPLFLDETLATADPANGVDAGDTDGQQSAEIDGLGIVATVGQTISPGQLASSPAGSLQLSENGDANELTSGPLPRTHDHLSVPATKVDALSISEGSATSTGDPFQFDRAPGHQLRRVPGGDLRAANHVGSLDKNFHIPPRERSRSPAIPPRGSSANATQVLDGDKTVTDPMPTTGLTVETASSKPMVGASFEKEVAKLAQLPDQEDDGGIDCALRRLEGRSQAISSEQEMPPGALLALAAQLHGSKGALRKNSPHEPKSDKTLKRQHRGDEVVESAAEQSTVDTKASPSAIEGSSQPRHPHVVVHSKPVSMTNSEASDSSIPLLERGESHRSRKKRAEPRSPPVPNAAHLGSPNPAALHTSPSIGNSSGGEHGSHTQSASRSPRPRNESFLLDDNETLSSVAGVMAGGGRADALRGAAVDESAFEDDKENDMSEMPNSDDKSSVIPGRWPGRQRSASVLEVPRPTNPTAQTPSSNSQTPIKSRSADDLLDIKDQTPLTSSPAAAHLPYILAYDSLLLAQQFTVIERDALCEVEWRDLIDLRWNQAVPPHLSWVEFLKANEHESHGMALRPGVDICISRFNLVVRWVKSEVVLTQDIFERALTITKYIHIAKHARRLRNWATMYQLTMALVSADVSRLKNTWDHVAEKDRNTLKTLETLIMPTRNFHNLREEIESATACFARDGEGGCIPFIGIYTHDLIYNAQKAMYVQNNDPAIILSATSLHPQQQKHRQGAPNLVNFERHHTAATIVKNLLRLIEASSKYTFQPVPEVASRCLWLGALSDQDITRRSHELEQSLERTSQ